MRTALILLGLCLLATAPSASADVHVQADVGGHTVSYSGPVNCPLVFIMEGDVASGGGWNGDCAVYVHP